MKIAYLKKDRQERYNLKRGWFVNAYRLVDIEGNDMVQPWFDTKTEARQFCKTRNWRINETMYFPAPCHREDLHG
jgi:hypothetical protein